MSRRKPAPKSLRAAVLAKRKAEAAAERLKWMKRFPHAPESVAHVEAVTLAKLELETQQAARAEAKMLAGPRMTVDVLQAHFTLSRTAPSGLLASNGAQITEVRTKSGMTFRGWVGSRWLWSTQIQFLLTKYQAK